MISEINKISKNPTNKIKKYEQTFEKLVDDITELKDKFRHITDTARYINKRHMMIESFINTTKNIIGNSLIPDGSFYRKNAEFTKSLETLLTDESYGDPYGSETVFLFHNHNESQVKDFVLKLYTSINKPVEKKLVFGSYRLDHICEEPMNMRGIVSTRYKIQDGDD